MKEMKVGNFDNRGGSEARWNVMFALQMAIAYYTAEERRREILAFDPYELIIAVDMLALMSEHYQISPGINDKAVRRWRDFYLPIFDKRNEFNPLEHTSGWVYERRQVILAAFARLETVAALRPPDDWVGEEG